MIQIENLSKRYGKNEILRQITVRFESGGIYGLVGANGCGNGHSPPNSPGAQGCRQARTHAQAQRQRTGGNQRRFGSVYRLEIGTHRQYRRQEQKSRCQPPQAVGTKLHDRRIAGKNTQQRSAQSITHGHSNHRVHQSQLHRAHHRLAYPAMQTGAVAAADDRRCCQAKSGERRQGKFRQPAHIAKGRHTHRTCPRR